MTREFGLLVVLLAACSGSGGSTAFTPSQNLADTHGFFANSSWVGRLRVDGVDWPARLYFLQPQLAPEPTATGVLQTLAPNLAGPAVLQAGGSRVRFVVDNRTSVPGQTTVFEGELSSVGDPSSGQPGNGRVMRVAWRISSPIASLDGDTGTAMFDTIPAPMLPAAEVGESVEVHDFPELLLIVRKTWR
jgi:hypothetical protein